MTKRKRLTYCEKQQALWIVKGYEQNKKTYESERNSIMCAGLVSQQSNGHGGGVSDKTFTTTEKLEELEKCRIGREIRSVDIALLNVGLDLTGEQDIVRLRKAILTSCQQGRRFPYEYLNMESIGIGKTEFFNRRTDFLKNILDNI
jgi:hypothetical protein